MLRFNRIEEKITLIIIALLFGFILVYRVFIHKPEGVEVIRKENVEKEIIKKEEPKRIYVYITGEVCKPGLYVLKEGDRIIDAVNMASGFTKEADTASINLAEKLKDEQFINIQKIIIDTGGGAVNTDVRKTATPIIGGKININIATAKEMDDFLPGIGETLANNIVEYRNKNGRFKSVDDLAKVDGIGSGKRFEKIKGLVFAN